MHSKSRDWTANRITIRRNSAYPPEYAGEEVHGTEEDEEELDDAHAGGADVQPLREDAARRGVWSKERGGQKWWSKMGDQIWWSRMAMKMMAAK